MDWFVKAFIKAALLCLGLGVVMGTWMALVPSAIIYRPAHVHLNLLGFVSMVIFGVAYHVIPRFTGNPLHSRTVAAVHWWCSTTGLTILVAGFLVAPHQADTSRILLGVGAMLAAAGAFLFIYNLWRTIDGRVPRSRPAPVSGKQLPVTE